MNDDGANGFRRNGWLAAVVATCLVIAGCASAPPPTPTRDAAGATTEERAAASSWPTASGDVRRSSGSSASGPSTGDLRWTRLLGGAVTPGPIVAADGSILAATNNGVLHALDPATGADRWTFDGGGRYGDDLSTSAALLADGVIVWPGPGNTLFALSTAGLLLWHESFDGLVLSPAVADGRVYVADRAGHLSAIEVHGSSHRRVWTIALGGATYASPALGADGEIYTSGGADLVRVRDRGESAEVVWRFATGAVIEVSPSVTPGGIVTIGSNDGHQYGVRADGTRLWSVNVGDFIYSSSVSTANGRTVFGDNNGVLFTVESSTGKLLARVTLDRRNGSPDGIWTAPVVDRVGTAYVGTVSGHIYAIAADGRQLFSIATGGTVASYPALTADGVLVVGSADGHLYAIGPTRAATG